MLRPKSNNGHMQPPFIYSPIAWEIWLARVMEMRRGSGRHCPHEYKDKNKFGKWREIIGGRASGLIRQGRNRP